MATSRNQFGGRPRRFTCGNGTGEVRGLWQTCSCGFLHFLLLTSSISKTRLATRSCDAGAIRSGASPRYFRRVGTSFSCGYARRRMTGRDGTRTVSRAQQAIPTDACSDGEDDAVLVAAAAADPRAFTPLYERYLAPIYRYSYGRLASRERAEDATSEIFVRVLAGLPGYRGGLFVAWLFRIARNVVTDAQRRARPQASLDAMVAVSDDTPTPEDIVTACGEMELLHGAISRLPDDQRAAVELSLVGWTTEQTARSLGKSPAAVKMLRYRALRSLRKGMTNATTNATNAGASDG